MNYLTNHPFSVATVPVQILDNLIHLIISEKCNNMRDLQGRHRYYTSVKKEIFYSKLIVKINV